MTTTMKGLVLGVLVSVAAAGCAGTGGAITQRGTVLVNNGRVMAFAAGPAVIHAYSQDHGGKVFTVAATSGTDADCTVARAVVPSALAADRVQVVTLAPGQIACVETASKRNYELLWHARPASADETAVAVAVAVALADARR
jgi:hypothetical protein